ncbi:MAG: hypothetical protein FD180_148 [Planctomycetota bacterium]|nr:MAG: hypothetical protein FD180_148 [Planctomycetota bacterium]
MNPDLQSKLLVYKAYQLGREAILRGLRNEHEDLARASLSALDALEGTAEVVRRKCFYTLILAELHRLSDPMPYRESAMELSDQLMTLGGMSSRQRPFEIYMKVVNATTQSPTVGNLGDFNTSGVNLVQDTTSETDEFGKEISVDRVQRALGLSDEEYDRFYGFLQKSLPEVIQAHGLAR